MPIIPPFINGFPWTDPIYRSVQPFTYRDGTTYLEILRALDKYVKSLADTLNAALSEADDNIKAQIAALVESVNASMAELAEMVNDNLAEQNAVVDAKIEQLTQYVDDAVESILNASIEVNDSIVHGILSNRDSDSRQLLDNVIDARKANTSRRISRILNVPARPWAAAWPSGFAFHPNGQSVFVFYEGSFSGTPTLQIREFSMTGSQLSMRSISNPAGLSSTENSHVWVDNGTVYMFVRTTSGSVYHVYNYTDAVLSPAYAIDGAFKMAVVGNSVYTCDARVNTGGVGIIYEYNLDSVKFGAPVLIREIYLEHRMMYAKSQGLAASDSEFLFVLGLNNHLPGVARFGAEGKFIEAYNFDKASFADAINSASTIVPNPDNYRHESEGCEVVDGTLVTGHVVWTEDFSVARFVLVEHGTGPLVDCSDIGNVFRASAGESAPVFVNGWSSNPDEPIRFKRDKDIVSIGGAVRPPAGWNGSNVDILYTPAGYRSASTERRVGVGIGATFLLSIYNTGRVRIEQYSGSNPGAVTWIPVSCDFAGGSGMLS